MRLRLFNKINIIEFLLICTPSLTLPFLVEAYELPKTILISLVLAFALVGNKLNFFKKDIKKSSIKIENSKLSFYSFIFIGYLFLYIISSLFATNIGTSILGYYGRFAGSLVFVTAIILFIIDAKKSFISWDYNRIFHVLSLGSVVPVIFSYFQIFNLQILTQSSNRIYSTFGQPNWFGSYLVIIILVHAISFTVNKRNISLLYFVFCLISLFYTLSISAILTLLLCLIILYFVPFNGKVNNRISYLLLFFILTTFLHGRPLLNRLVTQVVASENTNATIVTNDTGYIRGVLTKSSLLQIFNSPKLFLIGSGPENFAYDFVRPVELNGTSEWSYLFNKPHNFFVEEFYETGILGFAFLFFCLVFLFKELKSNIYSIVPFAILINSLFGWLNSYTYLVLFLFLAKGLSKNNLFRFFGLQPFVSSLFWNRCKSYLDMRPKAFVYKKLTFNYNYNFKFKKIFIYDLFFVYTLLVSASFLLAGYKPCFSYKIFPYYQNFAFNCLGFNLNEKNIDAIILLNPKNKIIKENIALSLMSSQPKKSEQLLKSLNSLDPNNPVYYYYLGQLYEKNNLINKAKLEYLNALKLKPNFTQAKLRVN